MAHLIIFSIYKRTSSPTAGDKKLIFHSFATAWFFQQKTSLPISLTVFSLSFFPFLFFSFHWHCLLGFIISICIFWIVCRSFSSPIFFLSVFLDLVPMYNRWRHSVKANKKSGEYFHRKRMKRNCSHVVFFFRCLENTWSTQRREEHIEQMLKCGKVFFCQFPLVFYFNLNKEKKLLNAYCVCHTPGRFNSRASRFFPIPYSTFRLFFAFNFIFPGHVESAIVISLK